MSKHRVYKPKRTKVYAGPKTNPYKNFIPGTKVKLYAIQCNEFIKIGISADPKRRLADIALCNPYELKISAIRSVRHEIAPEAEHAAHQLLSHCIHRGEWFRCEPKDALDAIKKAIAEAEAKHPIDKEATKRALAAHAQALYERCAPLVRLRDEFGGKWHSETADSLNVLEYIAKND